VAAALQFDRVTKRYKRLFGGTEAIALREFSLSVEPEEIFGFLGPNGAGKTTALHIAMGFVRPSSGGGTMLGKPFGDAPARRRVGFLAETVALYHRTAIDAVRFYGALNGMREPELSKRARMVLEHAPGARVIQIPHLFQAPELPELAGTLRFRNRLGLSPRNFVFGLFGYLRESKRVLNVLRAFEGIHRARPETVLVIAGDFVSQDLARAAEPYLSQPGVVRLGHLDDCPNSSKVWLI